MRGKELLNDMIYTYFMLVTMISGVMAVLGMRFIPDASFGYEAFRMPLIYAVYGTLPNVVMYARQELTRKQFLVRKVIQLILIEVIVIAVALPAQILKEKNAEIIVSLGISIFVVFLLTHLIEWFLNYTSAKQMTEELLIFQQKHE